MKCIDSVAVWKSIRNNIGHVQSMGFVPTMGCLHEGHAQLIKRSVSENDLTVLSIFVNPTQFNHASDFQQYPRMVESDIEIAKSLNVDYVFIPTVEEMYPGNNEISVQTQAPISQILEGEYRPGHFNGMLTVVLKLLLLINPTRAYFGEKDYQQYQLIKQLARDFFLSCDIVKCPTIRESSGLALSSRHKRLSKEGLEKAHQFAHLFHQCKSLSQEAIIKRLGAINIQVDYLHIVENRAYIAVYIEGVRLIDNVALA